VLYPAIGTRGTFASVLPPKLAPPLTRLHLTTLGMPRVELASVRHILRAIATTVVPESSSLDDRAWKDFEELISQALSGRDARVQRQLVVFLRLLQTLPVLRYGRKLTALHASQRSAFLESVERSRLLLVRRGLWGVRTLIFMGYYTRVDVAESIGYRANRDGWAARGGTVATVPLAPTLWVEP
jgi:hypothetical protein